MNALILAGGKGNRMEESLPKPLVRIKGKPILAYQLDYLLGSEIIDKIILCLGHRAQEIIDFVDSCYSSAPIDFLVEEEPLGTGGAIKKAMSKAASEFVLALNCDDITDINLAELTQIRENTICVAHPHLPFGRILEQDGYAVFEEKPLLNDWVSVGWYVFNKGELLNILPEKGSIEYDVFPKIKVRLYKHQGFWKPLNTKKDIIELEEMELPSVLADKNYKEGDDLVILDL